MRLLRSEPMTLLEFALFEADARSVLLEIGKLNLVHLVDMNEHKLAIERPFFDSVRRFDEMEKRVMRLVDMYRQCGFASEPLPDSVDIYELDYDTNDLDAKLAIYDEQLRKSLDILETAQKFIDRADAMVLAVKLVNARFDEKSQIPRDANVEEYEHKLEHKQEDHDTAESQHLALSRSSSISLTAIDAPSMLPDRVLSLENGETRIGTVTGSVGSHEWDAFNRLLFRETRGNHRIYRHDGPVIGSDGKSKVVFMIMFVNTETGELRKRILATCARSIVDVFEEISYGVDLTLLETEISQSKAESEIFLQRTKDNLDVMYNGQHAHLDVPSDVAKIYLQKWLAFIRREKALSHALTMCRKNGEHSRVLVICGWCPADEVERSVMPIARFSLNMIRVVPVNTEQDLPPTYFRTGKITAVFQELVDAYGVPAYGEVNPAPFTMITFPFLFAVMFGDFGHGIMLTLFALFLIINEKKLLRKRLGEVVSMFFSGRYMLLLMGLFSIYAGFIYNDVFSKALEIIPSGWNVRKNPPQFKYPYPFGLDPVWRISSNQLTYTNSYKMKMAIIIGVIHMTFGLVLGALNHVHFHRSIYIILELIPQCLFLLSIFGYLCVIIIYKWCVNWRALGTSLAPNLLNSLIFMFLSPGKMQAKDILFNGQGTVQLILLMIAAICIPWMLLCKPIYLRFQHAQAHYHQLGTDTPPRSSPEDSSIIESVADEEYEVIVNDGMKPASEKSISLSKKEVPDAASTLSAKKSALNASIEMGVEGGSGPAPTEHAFSFGDEMIHQAIHTIEFCLGCISNTASYLRLWALSLAHAQLSDVLWSMVIDWLVNLGPIAMFFAFLIWFVLTICILLAMESLSAFLHALRLHWVEFNNKFYNLLPSGPGYKFKPFGLTRELLTQDLDELAAKQ